MYHIIVNPASRTGKGQSIWTKKLEPVLKSMDVEYKVLYSTHAGHVIEMVRDLCNLELVASNENLKLIVLGGDGTLNEALQGVTDFSRVEIGYIPTGSSNDFARDMGLPKSPVECLKNILDCKAPILMDLGMIKYNATSDTLSRQHADEIITERYFDVSTGIGYDASVCEEALKSTTKKVLNKIGLGKLVYLVIALKQLFSTKNQHCTMVLDDTTTIELNDFMFVACMIHQYEGGGFKFCPNADYQDGMLDICAVAGVPRLKVLCALPTAMKGNHYKFKGIEKYTAKKVDIKTNVPVWVHTDGEVSMKSDSVTITCHKEMIQLLK